MARKKQVDTCHWVVKVELHGFFAHCGNHTIQAIAVLVLQGQHLADFKQALRNFAVVFKNTFRNVYQRCFIINAISFVGSDAESKFVA